MASGVIAPGRNSTGTPRLQSMMVDSIPTGQAPASSTGTASPNSCSTCCAVVGLTLPKRLALGAASPGTPRCSRARNTACAAGCAGLRRPIVGCRPAAALATPSRRGTITVSGPGQKARINAAAWSGNCCRNPACTKGSAAAVSATCTISGCPAGRPLAAKMAATARSSSARAARPYTVSVGRPNRPPPARMSAALSIAEALEASSSMPVLSHGRQLSGAPHRPAMRLVYHDALGLWWPLAGCCLCPVAVYFSSPTPAFC